MTIKMNAVGFFVNGQETTKDQVKEALKACLIK
jgi:hypothetical protein